MSRIIVLSLALAMTGCGSAPTDNEYATSIRYSADGSRQLIAGSTMRLYDAASGKILGKAATTDSASIADFLPDGRVVVFCTGYERTRGAPRQWSSVEVWDSNLANRHIRWQPQFERRAYRFAVSPDGELVALVGPCGQIEIFGLQTGKELKQWFGHEKFSPNYPKEKAVPHDVCAATFAPDGRTLATAGGDHRVLLWDASDGFKLCGELVGHTDVVMAVAISGDGKTLASVSRDGTGKVWDVPTRSLRRTLPLLNPDHYHQVDVAVSRDGKRVATADQVQAMIWDTANGTTLFDIPTTRTGPTQVSLSPDGRFLTVGFSGPPRGPLEYGHEQFDLSGPVPKLRTN